MIKIPCSRVSFFTKLAWHHDNIYHSKVKVTFASFAYIFIVQVHHHSPYLHFLESYKISISFLKLFKLFYKKSNKAAIKVKHTSIHLEIINHILNFLSINISEEFNVKSHRSFLLGKWGGHQWIYKKHDWYGMIYIKWR